MLEQENSKWENITKQLYKEFGISDEIPTILLFIGIQELGQGFKKFSKQEKTDLLHIATCKVLSYEGYYKFKTTDRDNWPVWIRDKTLPKLEVSEQESLIKKGIIQYFLMNDVF